MQTFIFLQNIRIFMKRKVVQQGPATLMISLPAKWCRKYGVKKGDEIEVKEVGGGLSVGRNNSESMGKIELEMKQKPFLRRIINTPYRIGYDELIINYSDTQVFDLIEKEISNMMGFAIISQNSNSCVIKNVASGLEDEFDNILSRLMLLNINLLEDIFKSINENDYKKLISLTRVEAMTNRYSHFCKRMLSKGDYNGNKNENSVFRTVCLYEEIADSSKMFCELVSNKKENLSKEILKLFENSISQLRLLSSLFNKFNQEKFYEYAKNEKYIENKIVSSLQKSTKDSDFLHFLLDINSKFKHLSEEIY